MITVRIHVLIVSILTGISLWDSPESRRNAYRECRQWRSWLSRTQGQRCWTRWALREFPCQVSSSADGEARRGSCRRCQNSINQIEGLVIRWLTCSAYQRHDAQRDRNCPHSRRALAWSCCDKLKLRSINSISALPIITSRHPRPNKAINLAIVGLHGLLSVARTLVYDLRGIEVLNVSCLLRVDTNWHNHRRVLLLFTRHFTFHSSRFLLMIIHCQRLLLFVCSTVRADEADLQIFSFTEENEKVNLGGLRSCWWGMEGRFVLSLVLEGLKVMLGRFITQLEFSPELEIKSSETCHEFAKRFQVSTSSLITQLKVKFWHDKGVSRAKSSTFFWCLNSHKNLVFRMPKRLFPSAISQRIVVSAFFNC